MDKPAKEPFILYNEDTMLCVHIHVSVEGLFLVIRCVRRLFRSHVSNVEVEWRQGVTRPPCEPHVSHGRPCG